MSETEERCSGCGRTKWEYYGPARDQKNCMLLTLFDSLHAADTDIEAALIAAGESHLPLPGESVSRSFTDRIRHLGAELTRARDGLHHAETRLQEMSARWTDAQKQIDAAQYMIEKARDCERADAALAEAQNVAGWAQAVLTALNVDDVRRESLLHKKLREVMITYRANLTGLPPEGHPRAAEGAGHADGCASLRYVAETNDVTALDCDCRAGRGEE